jgi:hypothetical protein
MSSEKTTNNYDEGFISRFCFHYARCGSVPKCVAPLLAEFPLMSFNSDDLNALRARMRKKNGGVDRLNESRDEYTLQIAEMQNIVSQENILSGKRSIDASVNQAISHLEEVTMMLESEEVGTRGFSSLLNLKKSLMELISKYSGLDAVMDVKRAYALGLLKQGKPDEASAAITGVTKKEEKKTITFMDDDDDDEDLFDV